MSTIVCPSCQCEFEPSDSYKKEVEQLLEAERTSMRTKMQEWQKQKDEEYIKKEEQQKQQTRLLEQDFQKKLLAESERVREQTEQFLKQQLASEFNHKEKLLQESINKKEEEIRAAREKELSLMQREQELQREKDQLQLEVQKRIIEEREKLALQIKKEEADKLEAKETEFKLKIKEMEEKLESSKKLAEEMKRKAEQGSMQLQGEAQELELEELLKVSFPYDSLSAVGKGKRGADCILTVCNKFGQECGTILFESKRTKDFSNDWIEKLKAEMRTNNNDIAILVTSVLPKDMPKFGEKDGIWICHFNEVKPLTAVLRDGIIKVHQATQGQENKGEKMAMLYNYLTSREFQDQWLAIREGFLAMRQSIIREKEAMEKLWKQREKQLDKVLLSVASIRGSIDGIGMEPVDLRLIDEGQDLLDE